MRKVPVGQDIRADILARGTPGFSGADLANLVNEAALFAARRNGRVVEMIDFEKAKDKIMMGTERKSMVMDEEERRNTAYHESGHALVGCLLPKTDPVHKVTIIPRGGALGLTMYLPEGDRYSTDKVRMESRIAMLFGGRIAEEVFMDQMTTGASSDFERATQMARDMVMRYGMSEALGPMVYAENEGEVFLGRSVTKTTNMSEETRDVYEKSNTDGQTTPEQHYVRAGIFCLYYSGSKHRLLSSDAATAGYDRLDQYSFLSQHARCDFRGAEYYFHTAGSPLSA
jgi:cell division protease FtsH